MWSAMQTRSLAIATRLFLAAALPVAAAEPARAFEWTVPASFHALALRSSAESLDLAGLQVPLLWVGGPIGPLALHFAGGWAYQRVQRVLDAQGVQATRNVGEALNFVTLQADLDWELPFPILVPYVGLEAMGWYPLEPKGYLQGLPLMAAPHAGVRFSLADIVSMDFWAFGFPDIPGVANLGGIQNVWNLSNSAGQPYTGSAWGAGGRIRLNL